MSPRVSMSIALCALWPALSSAAPPNDEPVRAGAEWPGKPTGPIAADYRLSAEPKVGVPLQVIVTARVEADITGLGIAAAATIPSSVLVSAPVLERREAGTYEWSVTIVPLAAEAGYLTVVVSGVAEGTPQAHAMTIPLRSPSATGASPAAVAAGGENLISLPVQETP